MNYERDELCFVVSGSTVSQILKIEFPNESQITDHS